MFFLQGVALICMIEGWVMVTSVLQCVGRGKTKTFQGKGLFFYMEDVPTLYILLPLVSQTTAQYIICDLQLGSQVHSFKFCLFVYWHLKDISKLIFKRKDTLFLNFYVLILYRERKVRREKNIHLFFHLFMHSLVDSCICPDWELNWQACCSGVML